MKKILISILTLLLINSLVGQRTIEKLNNKSIVIYCSIGVSSENIGEKLVAEGYTNVQNLYGSIFKWVEKEHPIYDNFNQQTNKVHVFSKYWGKLLTKGEKVLH